MTNTPTAEGDYFPPGQTTHEKLPGPPTAQIKRLKEYLASAHPGEVDLTNRQHPEWTADIAIRLLQNYAAGQMSEQRNIARCEAEYCNLPAFHQGSHGWTN